MAGERVDGVIEEDILEGGLVVGIVLLELRRDDDGSTGTDEGK